MGNPSLISAADKESAFCPELTAAASTRTMSVMPVRSPVELSFLASFGGPAFVDGFIFLFANGSSSLSRAGGLDSVSLLVSMSLPSSDSLTVLSMLSSKSNEDTRFPVSRSSIELSEESELALALPVDGRTGAAVSWRF